jgi:hypothetical protein
MRFCGVYDAIMERMQDICNTHVDAGCRRCEHPIRQVAWGLWKDCKSRSGQRCGSRLLYLQLVNVDIVEDQVGLFVFRLDVTWNVLGRQGHYPENQHAFCTVEGQVNQPVPGQTSLVEREQFPKIGAW